VNQAVPVKARRFAIEQEKNRQRAEDEHAHRPAQQPKHFEQHEHEVKDAAHAVQAHLRDLNTREDQEEDADDEPGGPHAPRRQRDRRAAHGIVPERKADTFGTRLHVL